MNNLIQLQKDIGYIFKDEKRLKNALTHTSYSNEIGNMESNERIEFLGDAILEFCISEYLYIKYPNLSEGEMTKKRAGIVCEKSLVVIAKQYNIGEYIMLGQCELKTGGRSKDAIVADAVEAIIGAIYLDSDIITVKKYILKAFKDLINKSSSSFNDYKTILQEKLQKHGTVEIKYEMIEQHGPDHDKEYISAIKLNGEILGTGGGKNKKESEQMAAKNALGDKK